MLYYLSLPINVSPKLNILSFLSSWLKEGYFEMLQRHESWLMTLPNLLLEGSCIFITRLTKYSIWRHLKIFPEKAIILNYDTVVPATWLCGSVQEILVLIPESTVGFYLLENYFTDRCVLEWLCLCSVVCCLRRRPLHYADLRLGEILRVCLWYCMWSTAIYGEILLRGWRRSKWAI